MTVAVKLPGSRERLVAADDMGVDESGTLILTAGSGRGERTVALYAAGAWVSTEWRDDQPPTSA